MFVAVCNEEELNDCNSIEWQSFHSLHPENYWGVSELDPALLASAFGAGFISLGTVLFIAKVIGIVLSVIKRG